MSEVQKQSTRAQALDDFVRCWDEKRATKPGRPLTFDGLIASLNLPQKEQALWQALSRLFWRIRKETIEEEDCQFVLGERADDEFINDFMSVLDELLPRLDADPVLQTSLAYFMVLISPTSSSENRRLRFDRFKACKRYGGLAITQYIQQNENARGTRRAVAHVIELSFSLNQHDILWPMVCSLLDELEHFDDDVVLHGIGNWLTRSKSSRITCSNQAQHVVERCLTMIQRRLDDSSVRPCPDPRDSIWRILIELAEHSEDKTLARELWQRRIHDMGESVELNARESALISCAYGFQGRLVKLHNEFMGRGYVRRNQWREQAREIQARHVELGERLRDVAVPITVPIEFSEEELEEIDDRIAEMYEDACGPDGLLDLSYHAPFWDEDRMRREGEQTNQSVLSSLFAEQRMSEDGRTLACLITEEDKALRSGVDAYLMELRIFLNLMGRPVIERMVEREDLDAKSMTQAFLDVGLLSEGNSELFALGMRLLFEGEYIQAVHVLVPQFEHGLRRFYHDVTRDGIRRPDGSTRERMVLLGDIFCGSNSLTQEDLPKGWRDTVTLFHHIFSNEQTGYNLRNNLCHGAWSPAQAHTDAFMVFFAFLWLLRLDPEAEVNDRSDE